MVGNFKKLASLYLAHNQVQDILPVSSIVRLSSLDVSHNQLSDISPLKPLNSLYRLNLAGNRLTDISILAEMASEDAEGQQRFSPFWSVDLQGNPLSEMSSKEHVATLKKHSTRIAADQ